MATSPSFEADETSVEHIQALGAVISVSAGSETTDGEFTVLDVLAPSGFENGWHTHGPAEVFFVVDGAISVHTDDGVAHLGPGESHYVAGGARHGFRVESEKPARVVATLSPGGFEEFLREVGQVVDEREIPEPREVTEADLEALFAVGAEYGIEFFGPLGDD
jgi:quercetin dioxygenase-like cupin family protein